MDSVCAQEIATFLQSVWNVQNALAGFLDENTAAAEATSHSPAFALAKYGEQFLSAIPVFGSIWDVLKSGGGAIKEAYVDFPIANRIRRGSHATRELTDLTGEVKLLIENMNQLEMVVSSSSKLEDITRESGNLSCVIVQLWGLTEGITLPLFYLEPASCPHINATPRRQSASQTLRKL